MARSPLFRHLRRALRTADAANRLGQPTPWVLEWMDEVRRSLPTPTPLDRRDFLKLSTAGALGLGLAACAPGARRRGGSPVVIVGAGIAGLTAGWRLRQAGVPVRILEAQDRIGGRIWSIRGHFAGGQVAELGGELVDTGHTRILALAEELGVAFDDLHREDPALEEQLWFFGGARRSMAEVVEAFRPLAARVAADRARIDPDFDYRNNASIRELDRLSLEEWLDGAGATGWIRSLLEAGYVTEFGLEAGEQSALNLLLLIDPEPDPFEIFGESDERYRVREGNDAIPRGLARRLDDAIETGSVLEALDPRPGGGFRLAVRRGGATLEIPAEDVILALPFTLLREVRVGVDLPPVKRSAIRELGYGTNAKLMVGFDRRIWREEHGSAGAVLTDLPFQLCWETSRAQDGRPGILTNFTGGRAGVAVGEGTPGAQAARVVGELEAVFPGISGTRSGMAEARMHWPTHPWVRGSYACYRPGQFAAFHGAEGEAVGRLHFAGEHTSLEAQGYMEGGCETGERAAREVLAGRGLRARVGEGLGPGAPAVDRRAALAAAVQGLGLGSQAFGSRRAVHRRTG